MASDSRGKRVLFVGGLLMVALFVLVALGVLGYRWFLIPTTDEGSCSVFDRNQCSALSVSRIENDADIDLPTDATIVDSGAHRNLKAGEQFALIKLPAAKALRLGRGYEVAATDEAPSQVASYLSERGVRDIDSVAIDAERGLSVYFARGEDGTSWAYVRVVWNG